jgi:hypothetical protein
MAGAARAPEARLSLSECRRLLPPGLEVSDDELERVRDDLYALAAEVLDAGRDLLPGIDKRAG